MEKKYKGLSNIGATCYMNSLLQALFMTPQFRYGIYKWKYNNKIHPKQNDSILYQLQKLFGKLQTQFPGQVTTKQLVKSFQWQDQQAQMQQDIQQFNRLLFQALQKSLSSKGGNGNINGNQKNLSNGGINKDHSNDYNFVKQYFEGELIHYTKCLQCQNEYPRQQFFQDLMITVKNIYEKVYNKNLELGLQRYLKPELLDQNNLYDCSNCGKKTVAERGAKFIKMPALLNIIFQRFTFNYFTMEREKINDRVEFPFILNFNNYIHGYEKIPEKLNEDSTDYFKNNPNANGIAKQKPNFSKTNSNTTTKSSSTIQKKTSTTVPSVAGKTKTKPSASTKGFLAQMRKRKNMQSQNQDLFYLSGNGVSSSAKQSNLSQSNNSQNNRINVVKSQEKINQLHIAQNGFTQLSKFNEQVQKNENEIVCQKPNRAQNQATNSNILPIPPPPPLLLNLIPSDLSIPYKPSSTQPSSSTTPSQSMQQQLQRKRQQLKKLDQQKQIQLQQLKQKNQHLIQKYLKQGPLVYELYAVLIHNGSANHGHYYCYIKSYEDGKWYCFNDERVNLINVLQVEKTFGSGNSNAYALYYRMIQTNNNNLSNVNHQQNQQAIIQQLSTSWSAFIHKQQIPSYIKQKLQQQKTLIKQKQQTKLSNLQNLIILKIYYQLYVKQLEIYKSNTLDLVIQKCRELFGLGGDVQRKNIRVRIFNPASEMKLDTFGGREGQSLEELKIGSYKSLLLEVKKDDEEFQEYEVGAVAIRLCFIQENKNLNSLDQNHLKLHKITLKKNLTLDDIRKSIQQKRSQVLTNLKLQQKSQNQQQQQLCIIKRHQNNDQAIHEILTVNQNLNKSMDDLQILQNQILFIETYGVKDLIWPSQFQNQIYRISIKYNNPPGSLEYHTFLTDSRISLQHLKNQLCVFLQKNPEDIIMKMGTKSGRELKDLSLTLKQARFITGSQIFFDMGIPAKNGQTRIQLYLATDSSQQTFNRLHEFQYITDVPISGQLKASQVKQKFIKVMKKLKDIQLKPQQFRIRQRVSDKIGKIYRQKPMKQQQLIQKRQISIELKTPNQTTIDSKQFSIYFRIWDQQNWTLSRKIQLIVNKNTTMKQIAQILSIDEENNKIIKQANQMCICRILSIHKFNIIDLTEMEWFMMNQDAVVIAEPMFVNTDGLLYVVKNMNEEPRKLTKDQQKKFGGTVKPIVVRNNNKVRTGGKQGKSMKIKVVERQMEQQHVQNKIIQQEQMQMYHNQINNKQQQK